MNYNYLRVFISGAKTVPPDPKKYANILNKKYIKNNLPFTKINNITFYKKSDLKENLTQILSGSENIYGANFTGYIFEQYTGEIEVVDKGYTDVSGFYKAEGFTTGRWINERTVSEKFGQPIYPLYPSDPRGLFLSRSSNIYYPKLDTVISEEETFQGKILQAPLAFRNKIYPGIFGGILILNDVFYDLSTSTISFNKRVDYLVTGSNKPVYDFTVVELGLPSGSGSEGLIPGNILLNNLLAQGSGIAYTSGDYLVEGTIPSYPLRRGNISGFGKISGFITGMVLDINSGQFIFNGTRTGIPSFANRLNTITGGLKASGILRYNNPTEGDTIIIENEIDNIYSSITFSTVPEFSAPGYFNSITSLNDIISGNPDLFKLSSKIINLTEYGHLNESGLALSYITNGENGNSTQIVGIGTNPPVLLGDNTLSGGASYYQELTPTGIYYGNLIMTLNPTGDFVRLYDENIYAPLIKDVGFKTFTGNWRIFGTSNNVSFDNIKDFEKLETEKIYSLETEVGDFPENLYTLRISYFNDSKSSDLDIAELKIFRNNIEKTGIILKGRYL